MTVAGIVLAGGAARRFGSDKLAVELDGRPLLDHAVGAVAAVVDLVIVALAPAAVDPAVAVPARVGLRLVRDATTGGGPLAGLAAGLEAAADTGAERALIVGGDMPWLRPVVLEALIATLDDAAIEACAPVVAGVRRPLPVALRVEPARAAARGRLSTERRSLVGLLDELRTTELVEATWRALDPEGATFRDVDRPADLGPAGQAETGDPVR